MAKIEERHSDNAPGPYYTDQDCVLCNVCHELAPDHFRMSDAGDHMVVWRQPKDPNSEALCRAAMEGCPMDAVGDDGDDR